MVSWWTPAILLLYLISQVGIAESTNATSANIEQIFLGRCWDYQEFVNPGPFVSGKRNCSDLWLKFKGAFAYQTPCSCSVEKYKAFLTAATHFIPPNKQMFWSRVYPFVDHFAEKGQRYFSIGATLLGYMVNGLSWCGQKKQPGINFRQCSRCGKNTTSGMDAYWQSSSMQFSKQARGIAYVMLNGSCGAAFQNVSYFAQNELVNLSPASGVKELRVFLVHDLGKPVRERCGELSLNLLERRARSQGLDYHCKDDPRETRMLQCVDKPEAPECRMDSAGGVPSVKYAGQRTWNWKT